MDKIVNLKRTILNTLDTNKALDIVSIDLEDKIKSNKTINLINYIIRKNNRSEIFFFNGC